MKYEKGYVSHFARSTTNTMTKHNDIKCNVKRPGEVSDQDHLNKKEDAGAAEGAIQPASVEAEGINDQEHPSKSPESCF